MTLCNSEPKPVRTSSSSFFSNSFRSARSLNFLPAGVASACGRATTPPLAQHVSMQQLMAALLLSQTPHCMAPTMSSGPSTNSSVLTRDALFGAAPASGPHQQRDIVFDQA